MAYPYKTYKHYTPRQNEWVGTTRATDDPFVYKMNYNGLNFFGGFLAIITVVIFWSWLKGKIDEKKWTKEWEKSKEKKELEKRDASCAGINPFGYTNTGKQTTIVEKPNESRSYVPFTPLVRRRNRELFTKEVPTEVMITVLDSNNAVVSMKNIRGKLQLEALIETLGLTVPKGFELRIREKDAKTYV